MQGNPPYSEVIRIIVIVAFVAISLFLKAARTRTSAPPTTVPRRPTGGQTGGVEAWREAVRKAAEQKRRSREQAAPEGLIFGSQTMGRIPDQPAKIEPESSAFCTVLLLALLACLCLMAYRFFAG